MTELESTLAAQIQSRGYALCAMEQLCGDVELLESIRDLAEVFVHEDRVREAEETFHGGGRNESIKPFLVKYQDQQHFTKDHPLYRLGMLDSFQRIASESCSRAMRMMSADLWYLCSRANKRPRGYAQMWHRDPEDAQTLKVNLFFRDVDAQSGPLEYVIGSHRSDSKNWTIGAQREYAPQEQVERIPDGDKARFIVKAGTVLFTHTAGLHRGGYTETKGRLNTVWTFVPASAQLPNKFTLHHYAPQKENRCLAVA